MEPATEENTNILEYIVGIGIWGWRDRTRKIREINFYLYGMKNLFSHLFLFISQSWSILIYRFTIYFISKFFVK